MQNFITKVLVLICALLVGGHCKVPNYFKVCHRSDPDLGACVTKAAYDLLPKLKVGIPEYDIPKIEPFFVKDANFTTGSDSASVKANISDIVVYGGSTFKVLNVTINPKKNIFKFKVIIPKVHGNAICEVDAKILFLSIKGKGPMYVNVTDFFFDCVLKGNLVPRNGEQYLQFEQMKCKVSYGTGHVKFEKLFDNPTLGKTTNDLVNDNLELFVEALKPSVMDAVTTGFTDIANKIASRFNYNEFFPE